ncbi:hypothetical protein GLOIN_2v1540463 [Rhizophagus irregularis DAOM 181602=DAOM 197198]|uniref:Uncharacterized protein n=1 Tax=Rhizophagus irregularis (strain DAOM 181602 / DAOM 197198 / MUCL 43194) TaxID=747089 RepID=A0A2P4QKR6_RHIID|nr:hypothetical protein GLOIN_2v1540463 [Rhizophagus irregularis DAOM 181602=DAOM 197198]POG78249.1 hypothetical protein GLOIN_2v1540463 [Rhizophagus irregularis DAOM 181602=DAOM 197198]|eukprot:XP_025185115.1 hypothetical protein GLOIN_2v1540463 [Rhizophagus irregularis DAOM 181602=DAOM 197198]
MNFHYLRTTITSSMKHTIFFFISFIIKTFSTMPITIKFFFTFFAYNNAIFLIFYSSLIFIQIIIRCLKNDFVIICFISYCHNFLK